MTEVSHRSQHTSEDLQFRGHRFSNLLDVEHLGVETVVDHLVAKMERLRGNNTSDTVELTPLERDEFHDDPGYELAYAIDLIGDTDQQTGNYREKTTKAISQLTDASNEAAVTFDMKPDDICGSCIFGHHCRRPNIATEDARTIYTLSLLGEGLQLSDQISVSGKPENNSYQLVAPARVVRSMMRFFRDTDPSNPTQVFTEIRDKALYKPFEVARLNEHEYHR